MALAAELLELTKHMAPDDAKTFENLLTKHPTIGEGWLRQADYDRNLNRSKQELEEARRKSQEWQNWAKDNVPIHEELVKSYSDMERQQKELQTQLAAAQAARSAAGDDTVDAAELSRRVQEEVTKLGYASRSDVDKIINDQAVKLAREEATKEVAAAQKRFYEETLPASVNFNMDAAEIAMQHMREFDGKAIDRTEFSNFMKERNILEPKKAYEEFVRPQRDKIALEKSIADAVKAKEQELQQQYSAAGLPGGGMVPPGLQSKGAVQMRIDREAEAAKGNMATSIAAQAAAAEMRAEGRF